MAVCFDILIQWLSTDRLQPIFWGKTMLNTNNKMSQSTLTLYISNKGLETLPIFFLLTSKAVCPIKNSLCRSRTSLIEVNVDRLHKIPRFLKPWIKLCKVKEYTQVYLYFKYILLPCRVSAGFLKPDLRIFKTFFKPCTNKLLYRRAEQDLW